MATRSGDPFLKNGIFQLEDDIIALQASDKQPEIAGEKVYSYNYALGIQEPDFGGDVGDDDDDDDDDDEDDDDDDRGQAAPAVEPSAAGERQKMLTPVEHLNLDEIDDKLDPQYFPLNGHESQSLRVL